MSSPQGIVNVMVDLKTGMLAGPQTTSPFLEVFAKNTKPGALIEKNYGQSEDENYVKQVETVDDFYDLK